MTASHNLPQVPLVRKSPINTSGVLTLSGFGVRVRMQNGHLEIEDGVGFQRRKIRLARVGHGLERLVIVGSDGFVSLAALRWLTDQNAAFVLLERDGKTLCVTGPVGSSDAKLRRAQALAIGNGMGLEICRRLIEAKLQGQEKVLREHLNRQATADAIAHFRNQLSSTESFDAIRNLEANAAAAYFREWRDLPVAWPKADLKNIPAHWRLVGSRQSPLTGGPRLAVTPVHAILNYCFALLHAETRLAISALGLDPGLGLGLHTDTADRDSLAFDVLEPIRPRVEAWLLDWIAKEPLRRADFFETGTGNCRLRSQICTKLSGTALTWGKLVAPWVENVTRTLWTGAKSRRIGNSVLPTRLTQQRRTEAKGKVWTSKVEPPKVDHLCRGCGKTISNESTPSEDVLPIRALYSGTSDSNIGLNPLTANEPIWYAGPDLAASRLATGRTPEIVQAFRLVPLGVQEGMTTTVIGTRTIDPEEDDFFRVVIEERKKLPKSHPHYLLLKIIANALYGIFAELNKVEYGKNCAKQLNVFSGEHKFEQPTLTVERPGKFHFPPAAALITAGGRLMLALLESMIAKDLGGAYLLTDTDSMLFVASKVGGLVQCAGGPHKMPNGEAAVKAITWSQVDGICAKLNRLNPYDRDVIGEILKVEDCNFDHNGDQHQLHGLAVSAKRYVVYTRKKYNIEIIKPSEHGLGVVYVPDKRTRYKAVDCKDQETSFPLWIVEAWERLLFDHFQNIRNPENALVSRQLWFDNLPAVMRVRITTPNVLRVLRKRDPGAAKPYNFVLSPILLHPSPDCTLIAPASKRWEEWLGRDYTEIHSGESVKLFSEYHGKVLKPQTLATVIWRHYLHLEDKSLAPDGQRCNAYTRGLLMRRPILAMTPLVFIGKEIERRAQEGEDVNVLENPGPIKYHAGQNVKTRAADAGLILRARGFPLRQLMRESGASQHATERFLRGDRVHPATRARLASAVEKLEGERLRAT
jgi:CRISPR-associated endonuclease Cas1